MTGAKLIKLTRSLYTHHSNTEHGIYCIKCGKPFFIGDEAVSKLTWAVSKRQRGLYCLPCAHKLNLI